MFFFGILGIEQKEKEINDIKNIRCKNCGSLTSYKLIKTYMIFHIFFIPLCKWNEEYYLVSTCCNSVFKISNEIGQKIEKCYNIKLSDENIITIKNDKKEKVCSNCGKILSFDYEYCPYCGKKLQ